MAIPYYFTPGPSELYFTADFHVKNALKDKILSISHRSRQFEQIYEHTESHLRLLLGIPDNYQIFFTSSATEIWERIIQNLVKEKSYHLVNGSFSRRFYEIANELGRKGGMVKAQEGSCCDPNDMVVPEDTELIAITHNETSIGASQPIGDMQRIRQAFPQALIAVDAVSSLPFVNLPFGDIDCFYFSVQKGFGLPAGLGVWALNERCIEKALGMQENNISLGSYHAVPSLLERAQKKQTPETPNVLGIYLLGKIAEDMLTKGIDQIRRETEYKAAVLSQVISKHPQLEFFVREGKYQSKTVLVANCKNGSAPWLHALEEKGMVLGAGYGNQYKDKHIRIANFPTHSKERIEMLADTMENLFL